MKKYLTVFKIGLSERLVYRFNFFTGVFVRFLPLVSTIYLWKAVYASRDGHPIESYTFPGMIAYYMLIQVARSFSSMPGLARTIAQEIREGELNKYLIRPVSYPFYLFVLRLAHKAIFFAMSFIPFGLVITWLVRIGYFAPWPGWSTFAVFLLTLVLSFILGFLISILVGLIGFWFLEVDTFLFIYMMLEYFLNGHMFPIDLLPKAMAEIVLLLPFQYEAYFPVTVFLGRYTAEELVFKIGIEMAWIAGLMVLIAFLYRRGLKRYAGFGG